MRIREITVNTLSFHFRQGKRHVTMHSEAKGTAALTDAGLQVSGRHPCQASPNPRLPDTPAAVR